MEINTGPQLGYPVKDLYLTNVGDAILEGSIDSMDINELYEYFLQAKDTRSYACWTIYRNTNWEVFAKLAPELTLQECIPMFVIGAGFGNLDLLKQIYEQFDMGNNWQPLFIEHEKLTPFEIACILAIENEQDGVFEWLFNNFHGAREIFQTNINSLILLASLEQSIEIANWLAAKFVPNKLKIFEAYYCIVSAIDKDNAADTIGLMVKYFHLNENYFDISMDKIFNTDRRDNEEMAHVFGAMFDMNDD